jgi:hypothetical protein
LAALLITRGGTETIDASKPLYEKRIEDRTYKAPFFVETINRRLGFVAFAGVTMENQANAQKRALKKRVRVRMGCEEVTNV